MTIEEEETVNICPICIGSGETDLPLSSMYFGKINSYLAFTKKGREKWRIRIEVKAMHVKQFLDEFGQDGEVAMFIMSKDELDKIRKEPDKIRGDEQ